MITQETKNKLWGTADKMRNNMDASEYKHVVLGLLFLKYVSDRFEKRKKEIIQENEDPEDKDYYSVENVFFVPKEARWKEAILKFSKDKEIGQTIDKAMLLIEKENKNLKGILPKNYGNKELNKTLLGELVEEITHIKTETEDKEKKQEKETDFLGEVYEYFLGEFALAEGKKGGEFYTPPCVVELLVQMIEPFEGRIYDPCCGSGGMFVHSEHFVKQNQGRHENLSIYGQESNPTTWKLCKMNLAIRGFIDSFLGKKAVSSFSEDLHPGLKADYILANPPFNVSDWGGKHLQEDIRWQYGIPPNGNANYAWIQHFIFHLSNDGKAGFVLANGSMSSTTASENQIRQEIIKRDLVEGIVALPDKLFSNTGIPACLWFLNKKKPQKNKILFMDLRNEAQFGTLINRKQRILTEDNIKNIAATFHNWQKNENYKDEKGYCKSATLEEIKKNDWILTPGRYVGIKEENQDSEPFEKKIATLKNKLQTSFQKGDQFKKEIEKNILDFGF